MKQQKRIRQLAKALCMGQPLPGYDIVQHAGKWWLTGFVGGDQPLPRTSGCRTIDEALEAAEAWLAIELERLR